MCGIGGYSIHSESRVNRTLAAQALLAGIAERGADAAGYAWRGPGRKVAVHKQRAGASSLLEQIAIPHGATQVLVHVRAYTKGHPAVTANNHPIRHRSVIGIHNGTIENDGAIFARLERGRDAPEMTVDSEAIFALADASGEQPEGARAAAWIDGGGMAGRARSGHRPSCPRQSPPIVDRSRRKRTVLRFDAARVGAACAHATTTPEADSS